MHESKIMNCLFGCLDEKDDIAHYIRCPDLWRILDRTLASFSPEGIFDRLGLCPPSQIACHRLALAFSVYHAIKNQCPKLVEVSAITCDFAPIRSPATNLAVMYAHELGIMPSFVPKPSRLLHVFRDINFSVLNTVQAVTFPCVGAGLNEPCMPEGDI